MYKLVLIGAMLSSTAAFCQTSAVDDSTSTSSSSPSTSMTATVTPKCVALDTTSGAGATESAAASSLGVAASNVVKFKADLTSSASGSSAGSQDHAKYMLMCDKQSLNPSSSSGSSSSSSGSSK
ncbi:MAG: hypothetical protein H0U75_12480 [Legionella sp.]|nr:hypothetical protein [Legionella sp.]